MPAKTYLTLQGDAWDSIAYRLWPNVAKSERLAADLIKSNPAYADVLIFSEGILLTLPEVIIKNPQPTLPAWRATA